MFDWILLHRDYGDKREADEQIDGCYDQDAARKCNRKVARWIAHLTSDFSRLPPAPKTEEGADRGSRYAFNQRIGTDPASGERRQVRESSVSGREGPDNKCREYRYFEPIERRHHAATQPRAEIIQGAKGEENYCGEGCGKSGRDRKQDLNIGNSTNAKGSGYTGIHDDCGHPAIEEGHAASESAAEVDVFATVVGVAHCEFGEAERSRKGENSHAAPNDSKQSGRSKRLGHSGRSEKNA